MKLDKNVNDQDILEKATISDDIFAGKEKRCINLIIDTIMYYLIATLIMLIINILGEDIKENYFYTYLIMYGSHFTYYSLLEHFAGGKTVGKFITKTRVLTETRELPSLQTSMIRSFCRFIPFEAFSNLGKPPRGWHDSFSKTYVIND